jgi:multidrug efflux system outer membrane protein
MPKWARIVRACFALLFRAMPRFLISLATVLAIAGCASEPQDISSVIPAIPDTFKERAAHWIALAPAETQARGEWWRVFADPVLDELVERAGRKNTSIQLAAARLAQARALVRSADAGRYPQLSLGAAAARQGGPLINAAGSDGTLFSASAGLSYELDLSGRLAAASSAEQLDAQAREAMLQSARLMVQADVAQTYFAVRALDAERALLRQVQSDYRQQLALTERRERAGYASELDVQLNRSQVATVDGEALALDQRRAQLEHALALLLGELASTFRLAEARWDGALPVIPAGIPSRLLARRPDVSAAQRTVQAQGARRRAARLAWFPNLVLTGSGGYASPDLGDLFMMSTRAWGVGALLALPVLDGGRRSATLQRADADLDALLAAYREQILVAFREVEDQLSALRLLAGQVEVQGAALASTARASLLAQSRYRSGQSSQLDVLLVQRDEFQAKRQAVRLRLAQFQSTVGLVRALGGSWDDLAATGPAT